MLKQATAILLALSLTACSYFSQDKVYQDVRGKITISQSTCKSKTVLATAPDEIKPQMKEAKVEINGQAPVGACWVEGTALDASLTDYVFVIADNGGYALFPKANFK